MHAPSALRAWPRFANLHRDDYCSIYLHESVACSFQTASAFSLLHFMRHAQPDGGRRRRSPVSRYAHFRFSPSYRQARSAHALLACRAAGSQTYLPQHLFCSMPAALPYDFFQRYWRAEVRRVSVYLFSMMAGKPCLKCHRHYLFPAPPRVRGYCPSAYRAFPMHFSLPPEIRCRLAQSRRCGSDWHDETRR